MNRNRNQAMMVVFSIWIVRLMQNQGQKERSWIWMKHLRVMILP
jgi:hypothetical protein